MRVGGARDSPTDSGSECSRKSISSAALATASRSLAVVQSSASFCSAVGCQTTVNLMRGPSCSRFLRAAGLLIHSAFARDLPPHTGTRPKRDRSQCFAAAESDRKPGPLRRRVRRDRSRPRVSPAEHGRSRVSSPDCPHASGGGKTHCSELIIPQGREQINSAPCGPLRSPVSTARVVDLLLRRTRLSA